MVKDLKIAAEIEKKLGLTFVAERHCAKSETISPLADCFVPRNDGCISNDPKNFAPIDILDYIYAFYTVRITEKNTNHF